MTRYLENVVYELEAPFERRLRVGPFGETIPGLTEQRGRVWTQGANDLNIGVEVYLPFGRGTWFGPFLVYSAAGRDPRGWTWGIFSHGEQRTVLRAADSPKPKPTFDDYRKRLLELHPSLDRSSGDVNQTPGVHPQ